MPVMALEPKINQIFLFWGEN